MSSAVFTWKISDSKLLSEIKESKSSESFKSDTFTAFGLNWHFELFPNGSKKSNMGQIELFIALQSIPNGISTIILNTKLLLIETNTIMTTKMVITNATTNQHNHNKNKNKNENKKQSSQPVSWYYGPKIDKIINLNQLTFKYEAQLIKIKLLNNNQDITEQWLESPTKALQKHMSLEMSPSQNIPKLHAKHTKISNISTQSQSISNKNTVTVPIPMRVNGVSHHNYNHNRSPSHSSSRSPMSSTSANKNNIESQLNAYKEHINNTMQQWALQVNKRFARMEKEISLIRKTINANMRMNHNNGHNQKFIRTDNDNQQVIISEQEQELKLWFKNTVKLADYFDFFIKNGINDLWVVTLLTMDDIKEMKIDKIGHRLQIMYHVKQLKMKYPQQTTLKSPSSPNSSVSMNCNCNCNQNACFDDEDNDNQNRNRKRTRKASEFDDEDLTNSNSTDLDKSSSSIVTNEDINNPFKKQRLN